MTKQKPYQSNKSVKRNSLSNYNWPSNERFPSNIADEGRDILSVITKDIRNSDRYLIVTGYTSLSHIVNFLGDDLNIQHCQVVEIVLGFEPEVKQRKRWGTTKLDLEIKEYWLDKGFSILDGGNIIKIIELVKTNKIKFKFLNPLHSKIKAGTNYAMMGSANFSQNGLTRQLETDIRFGKNHGNSFEKKLYIDINTIARNYYEAGKDYQQGIIELLEKLLKLTKWEEALARAISELLEGKWFSKLSQVYTQLDNIQLWPFQEKNLAEALYILQEQGCVLIANPTGSGKTRLISVLLLLLNNWVWETGRRNPLYPLIICPPIVTSNWDRESIDTHLPKPDSISMGLLSNSKSYKYQQILKQIKIANILVIDEAHNFLNNSSIRSENVEKNNSDYIILSTATPISKNIRDLFRLIELLDLDNLSDTELNQYKKLKFKRIKSESDIDLLRSYISKFIIRQTKSEIKKSIKQEPEKYQDRFSNKCQYPTNKSFTYKIKNTKRDLEVAKKINKLAKKLKGLVYLRKFNFDSSLALTEEQFVNMRIGAARALSIFGIQACLRSSRAAVVELVEGTKAAADYFKFNSSKTNSGDFVDKIRRFENKLPKNNNLPEDILPKWLTNKQEYKKVCQEEIKIYSQISELTKKLSTSSEISKINRIGELFNKHHLVVAFDSIIITLDYFKKLIAEKYPEIKTYVVTGKTEKNSVLEKFELGSKEKNTLGLFSDCMSEGVNLQQASAMVMLDMPCTLRIAEQRIGRIDRLDSPHDKVRVYWTNYDEEFALKGDRRLIKTSQYTESLIGSNIDIPEEMMSKHIENINTDEIIQAKDIQQYLKEENIENKRWKDIQNSFQPIYNLYNGKNTLISISDYEYLKEIDTSVKVKMSIIESSNQWLFLASKGTTVFPPKWYFIDFQGEIYSDFPKICDALRLNLKQKTKIKEKKWDNNSTLILHQFIDKLQTQEKSLLPNKKRRALEVAEYILRKQCEENQDSSKSDLYLELLNCFKPPKITENEIVDHYTFAQRWLDILVPYLREKRCNEKRKILSLNDLRQDYKTINFTVEQLQEIISSVPLKKSIKCNIASCILGVPSD